MSDRDHEETARRLGVPLIKPIKPVEPYNQNKIIAVCGQCGFQVPAGPMGYRCPHPNCPTGFGYPTCTTAAAIHDAKGQP